MEMFGLGDDVPMSGRLAPDYSEAEEDLTRQVCGMDFGGNNNEVSPRRVQIAGEYHDPLTLADITNTRTAPIPFGGPYTLDPVSSSRPADVENAQPTIRERRAAKRDE